MKGIVTTCILVIIVSFASLAKGDKEKPCQTKNKRALEAYNQAVYYAQSAKYEKALHYITEALDEEPDYGVALLMRAKISLEIGDFEYAIENFERLEESCPGFYKSMYLDIAEAQHYLRDFKACEQSIRLFLDQGNPSMTKGAIADSLALRCMFLDSIYSNEVPFDPKPVPGITTLDGEYLPIITPDQDFFYFVRRMPKDDSKSAIKGGFAENFCLSSRGDNGFDVGQPLGAPFNMGTNQGGATLTINNREMFITICNAPDSKGSCDIYYTSKNGLEWDGMVNMNEISDGPINTSYWESQVTVSSDGKSLYFSSDRSGGLGGKDLYKSTKGDNGVWGAPENLGPTINTSLDEKSPFIHVDNRTLYFSSQGHNSIGGFDIYIARRDEAEQGWKKPRSIGYPINSDADDLGFFVSTDGTQGYFASNKMSKTGWDIYSFELYEAARPEKVLFMKGAITDQFGDALVETNLEIRDLETDSVKKIDVDYATGEYVYTQVLESDQMITVQSEGHVYGSQYVSKDDPKFKVPKKVDFQMPTIGTGVSFVVPNINFSTASFELNEVARLELGNLINFLNQNPDVRISINGHTDSEDSDETNRVLSHNRAKAVRDYLVAQGIGSSRLAFRGYGESKPIASNETEEGKAKNRRTEIVIQ